MSKEDLIQHFRNAGNACFKRKSYAEAITNYEKGLDLDETNPNLNNNIAQAYLETHDYRNAEEYAKRAIKKSPESPKGYFRAARASAGLGYKGRALEYLRDGIDNCEDKKDLIDYYHALREDGAAFLSVDDVSDEPPPLVSDSDTDDSIDDNKLRSRSTSRMITELTYLDSHRENGSHRSVSMSRTSSMSSTSSKINKKGKKKKGPIEMEDILRDPFLSTLETIKKEKGIQNLSPEQFWVMKRKDFNLLLKEGSEVMASGLSRKAVEKYKAALDMIVDHSIEDFRMKEIEFLALKYALCVAWIELTNYADIAKAIEYLIDIESTRASKFPAVFYGLGSAYYKLNRFKASTEHLEKGLFFLNRQVKFEVLSWPGTNNIIPETTRSGLEELLKELLKTCRAYHEPDAICRYSQCLTLSSHIIPSDHIFYSDPDFCGFVVVFCEEKCKIEYHLGCWKEYKEVSSSDKVGKLSDKDFIGRECPTTDCLNQHNNRSAIVKIEIVGDDTTIKTCIEAPKVDPLVKESKKSKKKKTEKSSEASNQEKPKSKNRQKVKKTFAETVSQPIPQQEVQTTNSAEELESRISKLDLLRDVKFGYTDNEIMDPREIFFGRADMKIVDDFFSPEFDNDSPEIKAKKEFVFSFFYEYIKSEGPQKLKEVEQKWQSEVVEYEDVKDFMETQPPICSFLLQSYRFAAIDDYICLSEQLPDAYKRAKTELCESLSFTLTGQAKCSNQLNENHDMEIENGSIIPKNNIDISSSKKEVSKLLDDISEPCKNGDSEEVEKNSENNQNIKKDGRNDSISEKFDDIEVEDPDIDIDIDTDTSDSNIMKERTHLSVEKSVVSGGDEDNDIDSVNSGAQITDSEDKNVEEKEGDEIVKSELSPTAGEFQVENIEKQKIEDTIKTSGFLEDKTVQSRDSAIKNTDLESKPPTLIDQTVRPTHQQWSLEDSLPSESVHLVRTPYLQQYPSLIPAVSPVQLIPFFPNNLGSGYTGINPFRVTNQPLQYVLPYPLQRTIMPIQPATFVRNNALTQTDFNLKEFNNRKRLEEIDKIEEKINMKQKKLDEAVKKHDKEKAIFEEEKKKQAQEAKLENAKIKKEMEKEKNVLKEKMAKLEKENTTMKEKMTKLCDKLKNENTRLEKEKLELEKSCNASKEQLRDLISKTGQEVKELEKERDQYQELVVELKIETAKLKSGIYKQKCHDIRQAMIRKEGLSETESSKMTQVIIALQKCETALKTYEEKVKAKCDAVVSKIGSISSGEFFNIEWPHLPIGPGCPLQAMEELTQKVTEENRKLENSVAEGKHTAKLNVDDRLTFKDFWFHSAEAPKQQNKTSDNLDGQSIIKMEDKLGIFPQFETNAQNFQLNNVQSRQPKSLFDTQINPSAGMPLFQQTHVANQGQRFMMPHYFEKPRPLFPVYASQYPAVVPCTTAPRYPAVVPCATPTLQPTDNNPGIFANDKAPVRVQQIPTSSPATELKPTVVTVTDRKIEQPNVPQLMKDMQDLTLPVSTNKAVPEKKLVTSAFEIRSLSPPFRTVGSKPAPVSSVSSIAAARPKLVAVPTPSMSATIMKKPGGSSYLKLMAQLHKNFPTKTEEELEACVAEVREKNNNSLSGLALPTIITKVDKVLKERTLKKQGSMGLDKFGGTPWGGLLAPTNSWSKPKDNYDGDCPICMEPMERDLTSLQCKHCFHKECIKKWLRTNSICPNCRVFTKLEEEFPPLS